MWPVLKKRIKLKTGRIIPYFRTIIESILKYSCVREWSSEPHIFTTKILTWLRFCVYASQPRKKFLYLSVCVFTVR